jgi:ABC-type branched-subunit amino acid transport system ATPase component
MSIVLATDHLEKRFGGIVATNNVSLKIEKGARHALIGPNGAGKTTIINLLTGVLAPSAGKIFLDGSDITGISAHARVRLGIARTFQINQLFPDLSPLETLGLAVSERLGSGHDWWRIVGTKSQIVDEVLALLEKFHLVDVMNERTAILPYGKQRLLEIAVAIACKPRVLLLDEPAAGLSPEETRNMVALVRGLKGRYTIVLIEHKIDIIMSVSDRISVMHFGSLIAEGSPEEIQRNADVRRAYLGGIAA